MSYFDTEMARLFCGDDHDRFHRILGRLSPYRQKEYEKALGEYHNHMLPPGAQEILRQHIATLDIVAHPDPAPPPKDVAVERLFRMQNELMEILESDPRVSLELADDAFCSESHNNIMTARRAIAKAAKALSYRRTTPSAENTLTAPRPKPRAKEDPTSQQPEHSEEAPR